MPVFETGQAVTSTKPVVTVENRLPAGRFRFQLVCVDDAGNQSEPAQIIVTVQQTAGAGTGAVLSGLRNLARERVIRRPRPVRPLRPGG
jgi:hypothetical protein